MDVVGTHQILSAEVQLVSSQRECALLRKSWHGAAENGSLTPKVPRVQNKSQILTDRIIWKCSEHRKCKSMETHFGTKVILQNELSITWLRNHVIWHWENSCGSAQAPESSKELLWRDLSTSSYGPNMSQHSIPCPSCTWRHLHHFVRIQNRTKRASKH